MRYGKHHSEETKKKMSDAHKGKHLSEDTKKKLSENNAHYWYGKHHSEETKKKMRDVHKGEKHHFYGKHLSEEHKKKMSDAHKGKHHSEETKKKLSDANKGEKNYWYGKHHSEETKTKMRGENNPMYGVKGENSHMYGTHPSEETRKKLSDVKIDWDFVKEFGTTRSVYPYSMFFDEKHKKRIREIYDNRCVVTGMTQEEHIDKYGTKLNVHHWNHDKDSEDPFFMISVARNINGNCPSNGENKHEWISLFNGIAEDKWCEMLEKGTLEDFYKKFGSDINNCCYIKGGKNNQ